MEESDIYFLNAIGNLQKKLSNISYVFIGTNTNASPVIDTSWLRSINSTDLVYGTEPFPSAYSKCIKFFSEFPSIKAKMLNFAISNQNGFSKLYQGVSDWNKEKTGIHGTLISPENSTGEYNNSMYVDVSTVTFEYFVYLLNITKINVLIIDVEGYEYEILKQCLDMGFYPELIYYEEFNMKQHEKEKSYNLLCNMYDITKCKYDNLCLLK